MVQIIVPFAPASYKIIAGAPLLIFAALALYWGPKNLLLCIRMLQGESRLPPRSSPPFIFIGIVISLIAVAAGMGATIFFVALETTQPTIVSQDGILVGAGPMLYRQKFLPWNQVTEVTCNMPPLENRVRNIRIYSNGSEVAALGNAGVVLDTALAIAQRNAPKGAVQPCDHYALNHPWSY